MRRSLPLLLLLAATLVVAAVAPAAAHRVPEAEPAPAAAAVVVAPLVETLTAAAPAPAPPWAILAVVASAALIVAWRPRRTIAALLVIVAGVLAFETGLHSAHHLGQADEAARCVVAGMATQLSADLVDITSDAVPVRLAEARVIALASPVAAARHVAPDAGRAPPAPSA